MTRTTLEDFERAYQRMLQAEWGDDPMETVESRTEFTRTAIELAPHFIEAVAVLRNKMNRDTNDQENHQRAVVVLEALT